MNIIFMGTPDFSVPVLRGLVEAGYHIDAVVTQPDRPKGRKKKLTPPPVKEEALRHGLEVLQPETLRSKESAEEIINRNPDLIVTAAFGQILPEEVLKAPTHGAINVHASLLPKYRGGAPIHQAVIDGEEKTGITIMYMVKKLDAGDMLALEEMNITETDTAGSLHDKLSVLGRELLLDTIPRLLKGEISPIPQNNEEATFAPNIQRGQEKIDWTKRGNEIYNKIRGMNPWPVAYTKYEGKVYKIWHAEKISLDGANDAPGTIVNINEDGIIVASGDDISLLIKEIQPAGKKRMKTADFLRGKHGFKTGEQLNGE